MRILIVEPNEDLAQHLTICLKSEGFVTYSTDTSDEALDLAKLYDYDAIVFDLATPFSLEAIRQARVAKVPTPIIATGAQHDIETRVRAFGFGADDFMPLPLHRDELVARIHAVVRRSRGVLANVIEVGPLVLDIGRQYAAVNGEQLHLTGKEYQMLELLALRQGMIVTKEMFLNHIYGGRDEPELKIIDVFICKIRKKLAPFGAEYLVETVWGRGYTLAEKRRPIAVNPSELTAKEAVAA